MDVEIIKPNGKSVTVTNILKLKIRAWTIQLEYPEIVHPFDRADPSIIDVLDPHIKDERPYVLIG